MGSVLRGVAGGIGGALCVLVAAKALRLWSDIGRDRVGKPTPILVGQYVKREAPQGWRL